MCIGAVGFVGEDASAATVQRIVMAAIEASTQAETRAVKRRVRQRLHKKLGTMLPKQEYEKVLEQFEVAAKAGPARRYDQVPLPQAQAPAPMQQAPVQQLRGYSTNTLPTVVAVHVPMLMPLVAFKEAPAIRQVPFVPLMGDLKQPQTFCSVQDVKQLEELVQVEEQKVELSFRSGSTEEGSSQQVQELSISSVSAEGGSPKQAEEDEDLDSIGSDTCMEWKRAISDPGHDLPVKRTFIQFNTRVQLPRRRSLSV